MNPTPTLSTFRVQVAAISNGMRLEGHCIRVQATDKTHAAAVAVEIAAARDADKTEAFNADCGRLGISARRALPVSAWRAENVRRFASDNR